MEQALPRPCTAGAFPISGKDKRGFNAGKACEEQLREKATDMEAFSTEFKRTDCSNNWCISYKMLLVS